MTLCDAVGRLFWGVCKNGAVHHGLFLLGPPAGGHSFFPYHKGKKGVGVHNVFPLL